ncbi:hypothetical protein GCM10027403_21920 [Arthrobacter tecti]
MELAACDEPEETHPVDQQDGTEGGNYREGVKCECHLLHGRLDPYYGTYGDRRDPGGNRGQREERDPRKGIAGS